MTSLLALPRTSTRSSRWTIARNCPESWSDDVERCGGGFFHSPAGLHAGAPPGDPLFIQLRDDDDVVGVAVAVRHGGRWGLTPQRVYLPTVPAFTKQVDAAPVLASLMATLGADGAAVIMDSFAASLRPVAIEPVTQRTSRNEFVIRLAGTPAELASRCNTHHRRHIRRGERDGWALQLLPRAEGGRVLEIVQRTAAERGIYRGEPFTPASHHIALETIADVRQPWGLVIFSAWEGDMPLAAAVVGYANGAAYYISGGSTPEGYDRDASIWLHWQIASTLAAAGFATYNLGGALALAADPAHPMHGLHRFKVGFGSETIACGGIESPGRHVHPFRRWFRRGKNT
jgi:hypothetical protein